MQDELFVVDTFTTTRFKGNPTTVWLLQSRQDAAAMPTLAQKQPVNVMVSVLPFSQSRTGCGILRLSPKQLHAVTALWPQQP